jgi:hypothetical protein
MVQVGVLKKPWHSKALPRIRRSVSFDENEASILYYDKSQPICTRKTDGEDSGLQHIPISGLFRILELARQRHTKQPALLEAGLARQWHRMQRNQMEECKVLVDAQRNKHAESATQTLRCKYNEASAQTERCSDSSTLTLRRKAIDASAQTDAAATYNMPQTSGTGGTGDLDMPDISRGMVEGDCSATKGNRKVDSSTQTDGMPSDVVSAGFSDIDQLALEQTLNSTKTCSDQAPDSAQDQTSESSLDDLHGFVSSAFDSGALSDLHECTYSKLLTNSFEVARNRFAANRLRSCSTEADDDSDTDELFDHSLSPVSDLSGGAYKANCDWSAQAVPNQWSKEAGRRFNEAHQHFEQRVTDRKDDIPSERWPEAITEVTELQLQSGIAVQPHSSAGNGIGKFFDSCCSPETIAKPMTPPLEEAPPPITVSEIQTMDRRRNVSKIKSHSHESYFREAAEPCAGGPLVAQRKRRRDENEVEMMSGG